MRKNAMVVLTTKIDSVSFQSFFNKKKMGEDTHLFENSLKDRCS